MLGNDLAQLSKDARDTFAAFKIGEGPPPADCSKERIVSNGSIMQQVSTLIISEGPVHLYTHIYI